MITITILSLLGILVMVSGLFDISKVAVTYLIKIGLLAAFVVNALSWGKPVLPANPDIFNDMLLFDSFAIGFTGFIILGALLLFMLSEIFSKNVKYYLTEHFTLIIFSLVGLIIMVSYNNLVMLFVGIEIMSVSLYILAGSKKKDPASNEAALKYFLLGSFSTGILLMGMALIYGDAGSFHLRSINAFLAYNMAQPVLLMLGVFLLLVALAFKVSIVPFHFWTPDVYEGSPTFVTTFMATLVKTVGFAAMYKLFVVALQPIQAVWTPTLAILAAVTITVGGITAVYQQNAKRLLAYSSISNAGYMLLALLVGVSSSSAILYYGTAYTLASMAIFGVLMAVQGKDPDAIDNLNGLIKSKPLLAVVAGIALCSLAGIPLTSGFFAKFYVLYAANKAGYFWLVALALANAVIGVYYYFKLLIAIFFKTANQEVSIESYGFVYTLGLLVLGALIITLGIAPGLVYNLF